MAMKINAKVVGYGPDPASIGAHVEWFAENTVQRPIPA
jgi:hypothetical protein